MMMKKMIGRYFNSLVSMSTLLLLPAGIYAAQVNPEAIRQCGENLKNATYDFVLINSDFDLSEQRKTRWCKEYSSWSKSKSGDGAMFRYEDVEGSLNLSRDRAEALYELECLNTDFSRDIATSTKNKVQKISPLAMEGYQACLALAKGGASLKVENFSKTRMGITLKAYEDNNVRRVDILDFGGVKCAGSLADVPKDKGQQIKSGESISMICQRAQGDKGSLEEATIQVEVVGQDSWRYHWQGRGDCGSRNQRSCNGTLPVGYPATFSEESGGYDFARAISAKDSQKSLENMAAGSVPRSCLKDGVAEAERKKIAEKLADKWASIRVSHTRTHSCTKGTSGGKKDCGCKSTLSAPNGFTNDELSKGGTGNRTTSWDGTSAKICMHKSGKGRDEGSVTATWKLNDAEREARLTTDMAFVMYRSSCFNGCESGLAPNSLGECK